MAIPFFFEDDQGVIPSHLRMERRPEPVLLKAKPHFHDYVHWVTLGQDGGAELIYGGGQQIHAHVKGKYRIEEIDHTSAVTHFESLLSGLPWGSEGAEPVRCKVTREEGSFPFLEEVPWSIPDEDERPCLLYSRRYLFDPDPLKFAIERIHRGSIAYKDRTLTIPNQYFYPEGNLRQLPARKIMELGVTREALFGET